MLKKFFETPGAGDAFEIYFANKKRFPERKRLTVIGGTNVVRTHDLFDVSEAL